GVSRENKKSLPPCGRRLERQELNGTVEQAVERGTGAHGGVDLGGIGVVVATDFHRLTLCSRQVFENFRLVSAQRFCQRLKVRLQLLVFGLLSQSLGPIHCQIEMAASVAQLAGPAR